MSNTIKIIELLNKIANGEEVPRKVKYGGIIYTYQRVNKHCLQYENMKESDIFWRYLTTNASDVNDKVEIIEEQEKIDKLEIDDNGFIHTNNGTWKGRKLDVAFAEAINKLVEEVKNIKEKQ